MPVSLDPAAVPRNDCAFLRIGRMFPREFATRVFEPAFLELRREERDMSPWKRRATRVLLILDCLRLVVPFMLWRNGRPTRLARTLILLLGIGAAFAQRIAYASQRSRSSCIAVSRCAANAIVESIAYSRRADR
jgi:hypothetical protein